MSTLDGVHSTAEEKLSPYGACCPERSRTEISVASLLASGRAAGGQDEDERNRAIRMPPIVQVLHLADNRRSRFVGETMMATTVLKVVNDGSSIGCYLSRSKLLEKPFGEGFKHCISRNFSLQLK